MPSDISFFFFLPPPRSWIFRPVVNFDFKQNDRKRPKEKTKKKEREKKARMKHADGERDRGWVRESVVAAINKSRERPVTLSASYNSK